MPYRKKSRSKAKKSTGRRRRRVSGIGNNSTLLTIGAAVGGYFLGPKLNEMIVAKVGTNVDPKLIAAAEVLAGVLIPKSLMKNSMPGKLLGGFLMGTGANLALKEFGVISGLPVLNGYRDLRAVAGIGNVSYSPAQGAQAPGLTSLQVISGIQDK